MSKRKCHVQLPIAVLAASLGLAACSPAAEEQAASGQGEISVTDTKRDAASGDAVAQYNLAQIYADGIGLPQDRAEAVKWWRKAAEQGHAGAQYNLGFVCARGDGVPQDYVQAHKWLSLAAMNASDGKIRQQAAGFVDEVAERMTSEQIAEAQALAKAWKRSTP